MPLYLVRHGQANSGAFNPDPPLTAEGRAEVDRMAHLASAFAFPISQIFYSSKIRARQTAEMMAHYLKPSSGIKEAKGINPDDNVMETSKSLDPSQNTMLIGHLPFLERIVSYLIIGKTDKTIIKFQAGGIVCLDKDATTQGWYIRWALMPDMK
jgi:phosphohistidine phosphatase